MNPLLLVVLLISLPAVAAQDGDDGPLLAPPGLLSVPAAHVQPPGQVLYKAAGFNDNYPSAVDARLDLRETSLLGAPAGVFDIDGLSFGLDWIVADPTGRVPPPGSGWSWAALVLSVEQAPVGAFARHPRIAAEADLARHPDGVGGDLFSLILRGSMIPGWSPLTDHRVDLVVDSPEIDLIRGFLPELDAFDLPGVLYLLDVPNLPQPPRAFFSVTGSTAANATTYWGTSPSEASGATIFETTWNAASRTWSTPTPFRGPASLGLAFDDDIDALAVDLYHNPETYLLFSLQPFVGTQVVPGPRTGIAFARSTAPGSTPYRDQFGSPIGDVGLGRGSNVSAICALDPGRDLHLQRLLAAPKAPPPLGLGTTRSTAWLDLDPRLGTDRLQTLLLSEPCSRFGSPSWAVLMLLDPLSGALAGPLSIAPAQRGGGLSHHWRGCPARAAYEVPPGLLGSGIAVWLYWADVDPSFTITTPRPICVRF